MAEIDVDTTDTHTFALISDSEQTGGPNFAVSGNQLVVIDRTGMTLGQTRILTIQTTDNHGSSIQQVFAVTVDAIIPTVGVSSVTPNASGVDLTFSTMLGLSVLNLYDGVDAPVDTADVTLVGANIGNVKGSLLYDSATNTLRFVKTGGPLVADTYTLTLASGVNAFKSTTGELLDGDANGVAVVIS